jgi:hypothetical protein
VVVLFSRIDFLQRQKISKVISDDGKDHLDAIVRLCSEGRSAGNNAIAGGFDRRIDRRRNAAVVTHAILAWRKFDCGVWACKGGSTAMEI